MTGPTLPSRRRGGKSARRGHAGREIAACSRIGPQTVEALWVGVLAYQHRTKRSIHGGDVLAVILVVSICNVIVVEFFSGGLQAALVA